MTPRPQELTTYFALLNNEISNTFSFSPYTYALTRFSVVTKYDRLFFKINRRINGQQFFEGNYWPKWVTKSLEG